MGSPVFQYISPEAYLKQERLAEHKHEYFTGKITVMAGASLAHNRIVSNIIGNISPLLKNSSCEIFPSDLRVSVPTATSFTYPDASIVCGEPEMLDNTFDTLKNPSVIIEVVSPSTEDSDRGRKFFFYMQGPTFREYILVNSMNVYVQAGRKQEDGSWKFEDIRDLAATVAISSINCDIPLADIYANVQF